MLNKKLSSNLSPFPSTSLSLSLSPYLPTYLPTYLDVYIHLWAIEAGVNWANDWSLVLSRDQEVTRKNTSLEETPSPCTELMQEVMPYGPIQAGWSGEGSSKEGTGSIYLLTSPSEAQNSHS